MTRGGEVGVLMGLRSLFAASHLALVKGVAGSDGVLVGRHGDPDFAFFKKWTAHGLFRFLSRGWSIDHLLGLEQKLIDSVLALDRGSTTHPVHIVGVHGHLLWVDKLVYHWLAIRRLGLRYEATMIGALRVVAHSHLLR